MDRIKFDEVIARAVGERACEVVEIQFDDDENIFDVTIGRLDGSSVTIADCEYVHRAVLAAFDRNVEDYSMTVGSAGLSPEEADRQLEEMENEK